MSALAAVIDLGKTNVKFALVDTERAAEVEVLTEATTINTRGRYPCIDHEAIESFLLQAFCQQSKHHEIDALTVTTHGATAALVDAAGQLVLPVMDYEFDGVNELANEYNDIRPDFNETGSPRLPCGLNIGAQLYWQQHCFSEDFSKTKAILTWPAYWVNRLCGAQANDVSSLGCHTDLYAPRGRTHSSLVEQMNLTHMMPKTCHSGYHCGTLNQSLLTYINRSAPLPVYTGIHDSNASLVPHLVSHKPPFSVISTGTWFIAMAVGGDRPALNESRDTLFNVNAMGQPVASARFMGGREHELLIHCEQDPGSLNEDSAYEAVFNARLQSEFNSVGMLMPSVVANTGPYPNCPSKWINEPVGNTALRNGLVSLYLALMTAECLSLIGAQGPIFVEGPVSKDALYAQMLTVATGRPVAISGATTGTSVGAAMLIRAPSGKPDSVFIKQNTDLQGFLEHYAQRWRAQLADHQQQYAQC